MSREYLRKSIHILVFLPALLLRWLDPAWALLLCWIAVLINFFLLAGVPGGIFRDLGRRRDWGIVIYTLAILLLVLIFYGEIHIAVGAFALQALGDGVATLAGLTFKGPRLPWNRAKSLAGSGAFVLVSALVPFLMKFVEPSLSVADWIVPCLVAGFFCALIESAPLAVNDNLTVPLAGGAILALFQATDMACFVAQGGPANLALGVLAAAATMTLAYGLGWLTRSGALLGCGIGVAVFAGGSGTLFILLALFLVLASGATLYRYAEKEKLGAAQRPRGRRSARHVIANGTVVAFCALWYGGSGDALALVAGVAALAAALGDTLATELGMVWGQRPFHLLTLQRGRPGESGVVSLPGTLAGLVGALFLAGIAWALGCIPPKAVPLVVVAAQLACLLDSLLGATLEKIGILDNEGVNFSATLAAALFVVVWGGMLRI